MSRVPFDAVMPLPSSLPSSACGTKEWYECLLRPHIPNPAELYQIGKSTTAEPDDTIVRICWHVSLRSSCLSTVVFLLILCCVFVHLSVLVLLQWPSRLGLSSLPSCLSALGSPPPDLYLRSVPQLLLNCFFQLCFPHILVTFIFSALIF